jgi:hypothetical protein
MIQKVESMKAKPLPKKHNNNTMPFVLICGFIILFIALILLAERVLASEILPVSWLKIDFSSPQWLNTFFLNLELHNFLGVISIIAVISFWVVYYLSYLPIPKKLKPFTLGALLNEKSSTRKDATKMQKKAAMSPTFVEILAQLTGITATLGLLFQQNFPEEMRPIFQLIIGIQFVALLFLIVSADSYDTCLNDFEKDYNDCAKFTENCYKKAVRYAYLGMHLLLVSFIIGTFLVNPVITLVTTLIFFLIGYRYWFPKKC